MTEWERERLEVVCRMREDTLRQIVCRLMTKWVFLFGDNYPEELDELIEESERRARLVEQARQE